MCNGSGERLLLNDRHLLWVGADMDINSSSSSQVSNSQASSRSALTKAACTYTYQCTETTIPICVSRNCQACSNDRQCYKKLRATPYCSPDGSCKNTCSFDAQCADRYSKAVFCSSGRCVIRVDRVPDSSLAVVSISSYFRFAATALVHQRLY